MALSSGFCSVFLLAAMTLVACVSASDSDEYFIGPTEDKLLLACVIMLLVGGAVLLVVAIVAPCIAMRSYKRREAKRYHTTPPATRLASYSTTYRNGTATERNGNTNGNGNYQSDGEGISTNGSFDSVKINGVVYENPATADDAKSGQSFDNPGYEHSVVATASRVSAEGDTAL